MRAAQCVPHGGCRCGPAPWCRREESAMAEPAAARQAARNDRSVGDLVSEAVRDLTQLVKYETDLAKAELRADLQRAGLSGALLAIAAFTCFLVLVMLCFAMAAGLVVAGLPAWAAFLIVAGTLVLFGAGFRAVASDMRGYGGSDKPPRGYDLITAASDAAGLIRALGEANAVVIGHDWGALVAWTMATYYPKVVRRLAIVSAAHPLRMRAEMLAGPVRRGWRNGNTLGFQLPVLPESRLVRRNAEQV